MATLSHRVRTVSAAKFTGMPPHEVLAKSALNRGHHRVRCPAACTFCFAPSPHADLDLDLDTGKDSDREIIVKTNIADVLARLIAWPGWNHEPLALGTNTDPYQWPRGATG